VKTIRAADRGVTRKNALGHEIKPDVLLRGVIRADKVIDQLCKETIKAES
jgi:hypothetical protein